MKNMKGSQEIGIEERASLWRWLLILAGAAVSALLAATIETGRLHAQGAGFSFRGALVRIVTPNNDRKNDVAILCFENPRDSEVTGKILDLRGAEVAGMTWVQDPTAGADPTLPVAACKGRFPPSLSPQSPEAMTWDGRAAGVPAASGVYIYQLQSEDTTVTGTVLVVR